MNTFEISMNAGSLKEKAANGIFWGGLSTGVTQLFNIVIGIVLMKLLSPGDYGLVGILLIFTEISKIIGSYGLITALINRSGFKHEDYNSVFWFSVATSFFLYCMLFVCAPFISAFFNEPRLTVVARTAFISVIFSSFISIPNSILFKNIMAKELAKISFCGLVVSGTAGIAAAYAGLGYWALIVNQLASDFAVTVLVWRYSDWRPTLSFSFTPLKEMFSFSLRQVLASIIGVTYTNFFSVLIGKYNTITDVGYFTQGVKWQRLCSSVPEGLIQRIAQPVFVQRAEDTKHLAQIFRKLIRFAAFISFPMLFGLAFIGRELISAINADFMPCVPVLQIYCIWGAFSPIYALYVYLSLSLRKSVFLLISTLISVPVQIGLTVAVLRFGINAVAAVNVALAMLSLLVWHFYVSTMIDIKLREILFDILPYMSASILIFCAVWFITSGIENIYLLLVVKIILSAILYMAVMWASGSVIFRESVSYITGKIKSAIKL